MEDIKKSQDSVYQNDDELYGKQTRAIPRPETTIGIDTKGVFYDNIIDAGEQSKLDISKIESFSQVSQDRDVVYQLLDTMAEDSTIAAILETYCEDATETNDSGQIVWAESDDADIAQFVTYLLDTINVDKNIYKWTYSLCKYGDLYLRLFHESEFNDSLFDEQQEDKVEERKKLTEAQELFNKSKTILEEKLGHPLTDPELKKLDEEVKIKVYSQNDSFVHYLEMVPNPAEMFELTRFGKSYAYIKAEIAANMSKKQNSLTTTTYQYSFKKKDVKVFPANNFIHASLEDNTSRVPEEVNIFLKDDNDDTEKLSYHVRRGQSLLYNSFKIWRELMLLENSLLLNRITKSSIIRVIGVEVGDMPKENVGPHLMGIKSLIEQKSALDTGNSMNEYTNPGPMENNIYVPTHNGVGAITTQQVGGDVDVKGLSDIDYFKNKFYGSLRVPKQYLGDTDDSTGFNGGTSLSLISSRYAKAIKRIQNTLVQAITDAINIFLLDKGLDSYINKFTIKMLPPTTQEEIDRRDNLSSQVQITRDIMDLVSQFSNESSKLKVLKSLLSNILHDPDVIGIVEEEIEKTAELEAKGIDTNEGEEDNGFLPTSHSMPSMDKGPDLGNLTDNTPSEPSSEGNEPVEEPTEEPSGEQILPTPGELNIGDLSDNDNPELQ